MRLLEDRRGADSDESPAYHFEWEDRWEELDLNITQIPTITEKPTEVVVIGSAPVCVSQRPRRAGDLPALVSHGGNEMVGNTRWILISAFIADWLGSTQHHS